MSEKRRGLGRGLGALIPSGPVSPSGDATIAEKKADDDQRSSERVKTKRASAPTSKNERTPATSSGKQAATASKKTTKAPAAKTSASKAPAEETDVPARAARSSNGKEPTAPKPRTTAKKPADAQSEKCSDKSKARTASERKSPSPSRGKDSEEGSVSRETSAGNRDQTKTAAQSTRGRRDMGQALRNTTSVRRPVDMFFLPADNGSGTDGTSSTQESATGSPEDSRTAQRDVSSADVSRETSKEASDQRELAQTSPAMDSRAGDSASVMNASDAAGGAEQQAQKDLPQKSTHSNQPATSEPDGATETDQRRSKTYTSVSDADVSRETSSTGTEPSAAQGQDASRTAVAEESSQDSEAPDSDVELAAVPGANFAEIDVTDILPNRKQPRQVFDEDELAELAFSVKELGVLQPVVVRPSREGEGARYELVMGERRWRAVQKAGLSTIPAIIRETSDDDLLRDALLENLHRSQLNPLEEAAAYQQLMEEFGATQDELSQRIGRSRPQISNTLRLLRLPPLVQRRVAAGVLSSGHARALLGLTDPAEMERLAQRIVAEGMSVRATEETVALSDGLKRHATKRNTTSHRHDDRLNYIADAFSDRLDTSVKIQLGARKGKMTIEFASVEDLNRIIDVLDPKMDDGN